MGHFKKKRIVPAFILGTALSLSACSGGGDSGSSGSGSTAIAPASRSIKITGNSIRIPQEGDVIVYTTTITERQVQDEAVVSEATSDGTQDLMFSSYKGVPPTQLSGVADELTKQTSLSSNGEEEEFVMVPRMAARYKVFDSEKDYGSRESETDNWAYGQFVLPPLELGDAFTIQIQDRLLDGLLINSEGREEWSIASTTEVISSELGRIETYVVEKQSEIINIWIGATRVIESIKYWIHPEIGLIQKEGFIRYVDSLGASDSYSETVYESYKVRSVNFSIPAATDD